MKLLFREQANTQVFGDGPVVFEWRPGGNHVAVAGTSGLVRIYSRYGDVVEEFSINESVSFVKWDREGELLAVITTTHPPNSASANSSANAKATSTAMVLYEFSASHVHTIDISVGAKASSTLVVWSPVQPLLLLGDSRGNIILFNHRTSRKVPIVGKHQRAVRTGDFSIDGSMFGLGSDDQTITINSSETGDTLKTFSCNGEIDCLQFTRFRRIEGLRGGGSATDGRADRAEDFISAIVGKKNLMIVRLNEPENPTNLQFQDRYGNITMTCWFGNGSVLIGFERGFIVCLSAEKASEVSQEVFSLQEYKGHLASLCVNTSLGKLYSIGDNLLKIRELNELSEVSDMVDVDSEDKGLVHISASDDGTLTAVSGKSGSFSVYLTKLPVVAAAYQSTIGVLSSLTEVTIYRDGDGQPSLTINVKVEPSLIAVGPEHVVVALNNRAWFYEIRRNSHTMVYEHDYLMTVTKIRLNREFVMAELDGKVHLHKLPLPQTDQEETQATVEWMDSKIFPESGTQEQPQFQDKNTEIAGGGKICAADLSEKFLVYTTMGRYILYFSLEHSRTVSDYKHTCQPRAVFAESQGIRLCFLDERHDAYIYSPIDDLLTKIPQTGPLLHYKCCLWETFTIDRDSFVVSDGSSMHVFVVSRNMTKPDQEQILNHIGTVPIPFGNFPVMLSKGIVYCHTHNGRVNTVLLKTHKTDTVFEGKPPHELKEMLQQSLTLKRWRNAWRICDHLKDKASWQVFSHAALEDMNIDLAIRIFRFVGDVGMVWRLEELLYVEDQLTLAGHVTALLGQDYELADQLFCGSKEPIHALEMRRDIQHWDRALELARQTAPEEIPHISKEYAMQLEFLGKHEEALRHYEQALIEKFDPKLDDEVKVAEREEHNSACKSGIARMSLRVGDLRKGVQTALEIPGRIAKRDCGLILEQLRQFDEAGRLYEAGLFYDRAVASYLRAKDWVKVNELIGQVRSPKILCQYGKILVNEKKYERAYEVYSKARDYENMISLLLKHLNKPEEAVRMAQESRSIEGAKMVAKFFSELGNNESAIEFLVLSQCFQEAYELAEQCDRMDIYARALSTTVGATENQNKKSVPVPDNIAQLFAQLVDYYTQHSPNPLMAGKFAGMAKNYVLAMHHLTQVNTSGKASSEDEDSAIQLAVEFAAESQDRGLIYKLIDYLLGETDGVPKNPKFLFQFYVRLKMYPEAAKTAIIIAQDQQNKGFYKTAHDLLFGMYRTLTIQKIHIPAEMENNLQLLHSYNIVKGLIRRGDNYTAARLLIRVSDNISQFPMHSVPILTSTVITCTKAGFKASAFKFACQLLQPNYRQKIDEKYKRKIETVVRKSDRNALDTEGRLSPCPQCTTQMDEFNLTCTECKSTIPYCIVTGRHVVDTDFALCSACSFPGYFSEFNKLISLEENCPMCHEKLGNIIPSNYIDYINSLEIQT